MLELDSFRTLCNDVEAVTGIKTILFDLNGTVLHAQPNTMCAFCRIIQGSPTLRKKCHECDALGFHNVPDGEDMHVYRCHMGLVEAVAPVTENGMTVAYLMFGQVLPTGGRDAVRANVAALPDEEDKASLYRCLDEIPETDESRIRASARILAMCASYVRQRELLPTRQATLSNRITAYIAKHLADPTLSVARICTAIGISRTALYETASTAFGMGISSYIKKERIARALKLLRTTNLPLSEIARRTGFQDSDQLYKRIKYETGRSPRAIRAEEGRPAETGETV